MISGHSVVSMFDERFINGCTCLGFAAMPATPKGSLSIFVDERLVIEAWSMIGPSVELFATRPSMQVE